MDKISYQVEEVYCNENKEKREKRLQELVAEYMRLIQKEFQYNDSGR